MRIHDLSMLMHPIINFTLSIHLNTKLFNNGIVLASLALRIEYWIFIKMQPFSIGWTKTPTLIWFVNNSSSFFLSINLRQHLIIIISLLLLVLFILVNVPSLLYTCSSEPIPPQCWRAFSHDVTAAILVFQNNKTAAMLVFHTNPVGVDLFSYVNASFCFNKFA